MFMSEEGMSLEKYIASRFGNQTAFAESQGVHRNQVSRWLKQGIWIVNGKMFRPVLSASGTPRSV